MAQHPNEMDGRPIHEADMEQGQVGQMRGESGGLHDVFVCKWCGATMTRPVKVGR